MPDSVTLADLVKVELAVASVSLVAFAASVYTVRHYDKRKERKEKEYSVQLYK